LLVKINGLARISHHTLGNWSATDSAGVNCALADGLSASLKNRVEVLLTREGQSGAGCGDWLESARKRHAAAALPFTAGVDELRGKACTPSGAQIQPDLLKYRLPRISR
jgi:hypothetical protein